MEFTGQADLKESIISNLAPMMTELDAWKETWGKIPTNRKKVWLVEGKSLFLSAAFGIFIYLLPFFDSLIDDIRSNNLTLDTNDMSIKGNE